MKAVFIIVALAIIVLSTQAQAVTITINGEEIPGESHFALIASGSFSSPQRLFADSYNPSYGSAFGVGLVITPEEMSNVHIGTFYLNFSRDLVRLKSSIASRFNLDENTSASLSNIHIGGGIGLPIVLSKHFIVSPYLGGGIGGSRFSMAEKAYEKSGQSTLSELKSENNMVQLSTYRQFGILFSGPDHISLQYSYDLMNVERAWMVWHSMISGTISYVIVSGVPGVLSKTFPEEVRHSLPFRLVVLASQITASILWYDFNYEHHNWPFDDDPPLRYHRQMLALNYYF